MSFFDFLYLCVKIKQFMSRAESSQSYRAAVRKKVISVANDEFTRQGVSAVKMDDIASTLSISKRTLYEIFGNKEDLLLACMMEWMDKEEERRNKAICSSKNVIEQFLDFYHAKLKEMSKASPMLYTDIVKYPKVMAYMEKVRKRSLDKDYEFFKRGVEEGLFRSDVNYMLVMQFAQAIVDYLLSHAVPKKATVEEIFRNVVLVTIRGLCTSKGISLLDKGI